MTEDKLGDVSSEPMDVDRSLNSSSIVATASELPSLSAQGAALNHRRSENCVHKGHTSTPNTDTCESNITKVKRLKVDLSILNKRKTGKFKKVLAFLIVVVFATSGFCYWLRSNCCSKLALPKVQGILLQKLYGQDQAIEQIVHAFTEEKTSKITFLYGSTGVGKTYASQIILGHLQNYSNVLKFAVPSFHDSFSVSAVQSELAFCDFVVIVIDDVSINDTKVIQMVRDIVAKSNLLQKEIHLILIFNTDIVSENFIKSDHHDFQRLLKLQFSGVKAKLNFVKFEKLNHVHLKMCIDDALSLYKYKASEKLNDMLNSFDVAFDGCKGVHSKVRGLNLERL